MIQTLTLKGKEQNKYRVEDVSSYRNLLLWLVRLIHADPMLMLNVSFFLLKNNYMNMIYLNELPIFFICRMKGRMAMKFKVPHWN